MAYLRGQKALSSLSGPLLAPLVQYLGHSGFGKLAKLVSLDVLSSVPTLFHPVPQKEVGIEAYLAYINYI